jgi:hypothetical protein
VLPKRRVPDVANQDGGQQVPSAMTTCEASATAHPWGYRSAWIPTSMRCGSRSKSHGGGAWREAAQRPIPTRRFPGIVLLVRWGQSAG